MDTNKITFHSHTNHNPFCDIVCYQLDKDTNVTYGIYVKPSKRARGPINVGDEFMEIYVGENYNIGSTKRSHSRCYYDKTDKMPKSRTLLWFKLREYYKSNILNHELL